MLKKLIAAALVAASLAAVAQSRDRDEFCRGYKDGYVSVKGGSTAPTCPTEPAGDPGLSSYTKGVREGVQDAKR